MKILCDTHILIWYLTGDSRLSKKARKLLDDENNTIYYSIVSIWEVSIKHDRRPDKLSLSSQDVASFCEEQGFENELNKKLVKGGAGEGKKASEGIRSLSAVCSLCAVRSQPMLAFLINAGFPYQVKFSKGRYVGYDLQRNYSAIRVYL